jgi:hypothetical protein
MQSFFQDIFAQFGAIPRRGLYYIAAVSAISALSDILFWSHGSQLLAADYIGLAILCPAWIFATYAASMAIIESRLSFFGYLWFVLGTLALISPCLVGIGLLLSMPSGWDRETTFGVFIALTLVTIPLVSFLSSWPIFQARAQSWIAPMRIFKATRGYRLSLLLMPFLGSGLNKIVPSISTAPNIGTAILIAVGDFVVSCASLMLTASIAVTAWRYAIKRDEELPGGQI